MMRICNCEQCPSRIRIVLKFSADAVPLTSTRPAAEDLAAIAASMDGAAVVRAGQMPCQFTDGQRLVPTSVCVGNLACPGVRERERARRYLQGAASPGLDFTPVVDELM